MKISRHCFFGALCVLGLVRVAFGAAPASDTKLLRERSPAQRPTILVLGCVHFDNPGRDVVNIKVEDVLSPARQAEIAKVVDQLAAFHPNYVAVEWPRTAQEKLDARYRDYREGRYELSRDERDQLGLRLAAKLSLQRVNAVDWNDNPPGEDNLYDWPEYAKSHGQAELLSALMDPHRSLGIVPQGTRSIGAWLLKMNSPDILAASQRNYFDFAMIGDEQQQPGANWVGGWYARNLRIFNNLVLLAGRPEDRVLVIYGAGHAYLLRQFARESGAFRLVDVGAVLNEK
jgi:Family of unknown function (DUF5694)